MSEPRQAIKHKDKQKSAKQPYKNRMCSLHLIIQIASGFSCQEMNEVF